MSNPGMQPSPIRQQLEAAQNGGAPPQPAPGAEPPANSLAGLAAAYARCEQTKTCTPQDRQTLQQGLPQLVQMAKNIQQILAATAGGGGQPQPGQQPAPQPAPQQ